MRGVACLAAGALIALCLVGCGVHKVRVLLDFFPNPNHVPLYAALERGFFAQEGIEVEILVPGDPSDPAKLAAARTVELALTPQINFLIARAAGLPLIATAALIDRSLGGLLSLKEYGVKTPSDLRNKKIGYSLAPLEPVLWRTVLRCAGVGEGEVELVNVGLGTVPALLSHQVDAIGAFRNFEPIEVELLGREPVYFAQEDYCVPETYEVVVVANPELLRGRREDLRAFVRGLVQGIAYTEAHPEEAFAAFLRTHPDLDDELNRRSYAATLPLYARGARHDDPDEWNRVQAYLFQSGVIERELPLEELYTDDLLSGR